MKKIFALVMALAILMAAAAPSFAQGRNRSRDSRARSSRTYDNRGYYDNSGYDNSRAYYDYGYRDNRSFWEKHRNKITVAAGTAGGAVIGGLVGGKKGAIIGALAGLGGSSLYTYKIRNRR